MSSFGIGLGGFMDGFQKSRQIRLDEEDRKLRNDRLKIQDGRQAKLDVRADIENQREDLEYNRAKSQRDAVDAIGAGAKQEFDARVQAGTAEPDQFDDFFGKYALPKLKSTYLLQGDIEGAKKVQEWGDSAGAKAGAKLFGSSLMKSQAGDWEGSIADANKALQQPGYFGDGYSLNIVDKLVDPTGKSLGYRVKLDRPNGEPVLQDVPFEQFPNLVASLGNPDEAYKHQQAALSEAAKRNQDLDTYTKKKEIDKSYGVGGGAASPEKLRKSAVEQLLKEMPGPDVTDPERVGFGQIPREKQEEFVRQRIDLLSGSSNQPGLAAPAKRKVIVDTATGKPVTPDAVAADQLKSASTQAVAEERTKPQSREEAVAYAIGNAAERVKLGDDPKLIAQDLLNNGVPQESWPQELRQALPRGAGMVGLGR